MIQTRIDYSHDALTFAGAPELPNGLRYRVYTQEKCSPLGLRVQWARTHVQIVRPNPTWLRRHQADLLVEIVAHPVDQLTGRPTSILMHSSLAELAREAAEKLGESEGTRHRTTRRHLELV